MVSHLERRRKKSRGSLLTPVDNPHIEGFFREVKESLSERK